MSPETIYSLSPKLHVLIRKMGINNPDEVTMSLNELMH